MKNLAGSKDAPTMVLGELTLAGIPSIEEEAKGEVPCKHRGEIIIDGIEIFTFRRAWYYWVVNGRIPLHVACELYEDPIGRESVRVSGHCGCPPPEKWVEWLFPTPSEVQVWSEKAKQQCLDAMRSKDDWFAKSIKEGMAKSVYSDDPASMGAYPYITLYHVDNQEGLNLLVKAIRSLAGGAKAT